MTFISSNPTFRNGAGFMSLWYSPHNQITFNRPYNFVIGVRGGGKTYNTLKYAIRRFLKTGEQFIYMRRQDTQLKDACIGKKDKDGTSTGDLFAFFRHENEFPGVEFKVQKDSGGGFTFMINNKVAGFGRALSISMSRKSKAMPLVKTIIYDEFCIDTKSRYERYLPEEVFIFDNFVETVSRGRDIKILFVANAFSMVNPYFLEFGIRVQNPQNNKVYKGKYWTLVIWRSDEFIEQREQSQIFQARKGSKFHSHAFENNFFLDETEFIRKRPHHTEHFFSISYQQKLYGVWADWDKGCFYISTKGANNTKDRTISMSLADNSPNNVNIRRYRNLPAIKNFRKAVDSNDVYYDSLTTWNALSEIIYLFKTTV